MPTEKECVRVLLVEDSPSDAQLLCEYLSQYQFQVFEIRHVECLAEAVRLSTQETFDVILLDLTLPDGSGLGTCAQMRRAVPRVPIIVLTGVDNEEIAWEAMDEGVEDYVVKGQVHGGSLARAIRYAVERNRTQQALRESELRLKLAQQSAGAGVWDWDVETGRLSWSPELFGLFGLDPSETKASFDAWWSVVHPGDRQVVETEIERTIQDHMPLRSECRIILGTGEVRWIQALGNAVYSDRGQAQRMSGICIDITERKRAEAELQRLAEQRQLALDAAHMGWWHYDPITRIASGDDGYKEIFGLSGYEGSNDEIPAQIIHPEDLPSVRAKVEAALDPVDPQPFVARCRIRRPDGKTRWIEAHGVASFEDADGGRRATSFVGTVTDITDRKQAKEVCETAATFLRLVNESRSKEDLIHGAVAFFHEKSGCEAVGIRVKDGDDFPYYETQGFPEEFVLLESQLCLRDEAGCPVHDSEGYPILECMCGNVICRRFDPSKPFFTEKGSFWTNCTTQLLATSTETDRQARTRNRCNGEGYESVALIPLTVGDERLGLLQLNDKRRGRFAAETIALWERLAGYLAVGLAKTMAEEELREAHRCVRQQAEELRVANEGLHAQAEELLTANEELSRHEQALVRAKEYWERTFHSVPDLIVILDDRHRIVQANRAMRERLGVASEQCLGLHCYEAVHGMSAPPSYCPHARTLRDGHEHFTEVHEERLGGDFLISTTPLYDGHGKMIGSVHVARDITERMQAERKIRRQTTILQGINRIFRKAMSVRTDEELGRVCLATAEEITQSKFGFIGEVKDGVLDKLAVSGPAGQVCKMKNWVGRCASGGRCQTLGIYDRVVADGKSLLINDPARHFGRIGVPDGHPPLTAFLGAPLIHEGKTIGMIAVANREGGYSQDELEALESLTPAVVETFLRKRAEMALRENEQRLRLALEAGRMGLWEWDVESGHGVWDARMQEILGATSRVPATYETFLQHVDRRDVEALEKAIQESSVGDSDDFQAEFRLTRSAGEPLWGTICGRTIRDMAGKAARRIGIIYDVSQRKQMEQDLRCLNDELEAKVKAQTEVLQRTVDSLQDEVASRMLAEGELRRQGQILTGFFRHTITPLAFMDRHFNFIQVNEAYAKADGKSPEFFKGRNHFDLYPHAENKAIFDEVVRTGRLYRAHAKPFSYPGDPSRVTYWDWQLTPLRDDQGEVQYLVLNLQDVTQRQVALNELEHRAHQLQRLTLELSQAEDRERKRMAEVLHDGLQQQLAAARFQLGMLTRRAKNDVVMQEIASQLDKMLRDGVEQSRSLSHELSPALLYKSDLGETFEWLARQVQTKHGLTVHTEVHGLVDAQSEPIKAFLFRAGREILFNTVKHAKVEEARLRLRRRGEQLCLTIADRGQGFDPAGLAQAAGFGLLSIRERVRLLGGRMKICSIPGRGSVFLIAVPDTRRTEETKQTGAHRR